MSKHFFYGVAILTVLLSLVFFFFPQIDLAISQFFYHSKYGFLLQRYYFYLHLGLFRNLLVFITYGFIVVIFYLLVRGWWQKKIYGPFTPKACLFIILCFALGPVLIVNTLLKDHWGRARPFQVQQFGGDKIFTPAWVISNQCDKNCSFTSGESANVFCYLALFFIMRQKKLITAIVLSLGAFISFERIGQGEHFFSDTLLSGFLDYLLIWVVYHTLKQLKFQELPLQGTPSYVTQELPNLYKGEKHVD